MNNNKQPVRKLNRYFNLNRKELVRAKSYICGPGNISIFSRSSPNNNNANEDSVGVIPIDDNTAVLMVADGVGGHVHGKEASMLVLTEIRKAVARAVKKGGSLREGVLSGIEKANIHMQKKLAGSASTLAVAEIQERNLSTYHVGDTEILTTDSAGNINYQSIAHSPVGYAVEAGMLDEQQAIMHDERHLVSNVVGDADMHIDVSTNIEMNPNETLLIATDGLFDNLQKSEIVEYICEDELDSCSQALVEHATQRMFEQETDQPSKFDDLSFILFRPRE